MNSWGCVKGVAADSIIPFHKKLAFLMITNTINLVHFWMRARMEHDNVAMK